MDKTKKILENNGKNNKIMGKMDAKMRKTQQNGEFFYF